MPSPLLAVPNATVHPSTASIPTNSYYSVYVALLPSGVVEEEHGERHYPKYFFGGTPFPQIISGQGGAVIQ